MTDVMTQRRHTALLDSWRLRVDLWHPNANPRHRAALAHTYATTRPTTTVPWAAFTDYIQTNYRSTGGAETSGNETIGVRQIAEILDVSVRHVQTMQSRGSLDPALADKLAGRLRVHPAEIWSDWWDISQEVA